MGEHSGAEERRLPGVTHGQELALDLFAFLATLLFAVQQRWSTTDLVWSLWLSSLLLGYLYLLASLAGQAHRGTQRSGHPLGRMALVGGALLTLLFFTVHFGMFHLVHGIFLSTFFPLTPDGYFPDLLGNQGYVSVFGGMIAVVLGRYWPFLLATLLSRLDSYRTAFHSERAMAQPYYGVVRMHLLIFLFAFMQALGLEGFSLYVLLLFYFFPLGELVAFARAALGGAWS